MDDFNETHVWNKRLGRWVERQRPPIKPDSIMHIRRIKATGFVLGEEGDVEDVYINHACPPMCPGNTPTPDKDAEIERLKNLLTEAMTFIETVEQMEICEERRDVCCEDCLEGFNGCELQLKAGTARSNLHRAEQALEGDA